MNEDLLAEEIAKYQRLKAVAKTIKPEQWKAVAKVMEYFGTGFTQEEMIGHFDLQINRLTHAWMEGREVVA